MKQVTYTCGCTYSGDLVSSFCPFCDKPILLEEEGKMPQMKRRRPKKRKQGNIVQMPLRQGNQIKPAPEMFPWETPHQYEYRNTIGEIGAEAWKALRAMENASILPTHDYTIAKEIIDKCNQRLKQVEPPSMYEEAHGYLEQALQAYANAMKILVTAVPAKDANQIYRAGRFINEGTSFVQLTKSRTWGAIEERNNAQQ